MIEFLTTAGTIAGLQRVIDQARQRIVLISPYVQLSPDVQQRLASASSRGVSAIFVYGKQRKLKPDQVAALASIRGLELRFFKDLHAKCYFSDAGLILTSMNLYQASQNNREMGVFVTPDERLYQQAGNEAAQIVQHAEVVPTPKAAPSDMQAFLQQLAGLPPTATQEPRLAYRAGRSFTKRRPAQEFGHCIRCNEEITLDPNAPHCKKCYRSWKRFENRDYEENHCHDCGKAHHTSVNRPLCRTCFVREPNAFQRTG